MIKISLTTSLSEKFVFYICGLIKNNIQIENIFIQVDIYRPKRELKKLKNSGISYFPRYLLSYLTYNILGLRCSIPKYIFYIISKVFFKVNIDDYESLMNNTSFKSGSLKTKIFYINLEKLKLFLEKYSPKTSIILVKNINSDIHNPVIDKEFDYLILIGGAVIKNKIINKINARILCIHNSMLPLLRGWGGGEIWALIKNIPHAIGQTVFFITKGIDDGEILFQKRLLLSNNDDLNSIIDRNIDNGLEVLIESINMLITNNLKTIKQDEKKVIKINGRPTLSEIKIGKENLKKIIGNL